MKLYEIEANIEQAIQNMFDSVNDETGEVNPEAIENLESLKEEREVKIENIACYIKNIDAEAKAIKAEEDALAKRRKALENKSNRLTEFLKMHLDVSEKIKTPRVVISFRKSTRIEADESILAKKWLVITTKADKTAIKEALQNGKKIKGAQIVENYSLQIK